LASRVSEVNEVPEDLGVKQSILRSIPLSDNMFAHKAAREPMARVATGFGVAMAAIAAIGLGAGAAAAAPQQPFAADDPIPGMPGAGNAVNIANSLFGSLSGLMNNVFPGAGDLLMPATGALGGGGGLPGGLPGGLGGLGGLPGGLPGQALPGGIPGGLPAGIPGGLSGQTLPGGIPGQAPGLGGYPGGLAGQTMPGQVSGGLPGQQLPGQMPGLSSYPGSTVPGGPTPLTPGRGPAAAGPVASPQAPLTGQPDPVAAASANGGTLVHVPVV
jgi:hypothetical protein